MEQGYERHRADAERIITQQSLVEGADIAIRKISANSDSGVGEGKTLSGNLLNDVVVGAPINLESDDGRSNTTQVLDVYEKDGRTLIRTRTSIYELIKRKPKTVTTAKGSTYRYLDDGRTQRFKEATQELNDPQDLLLFIPPWQTVRDKVIEIYPDFFSEETTDHDFLQELLSYIHLPGKTVRVIDSDGQSLKTWDDIDEGERVFIAFINKQNNSVDFHIPVVPDPRLGWNTFDTRRYVSDEDGHTYVERHIGNKVTDVEY